MRLFLLLLLVSSSLSFTVPPSLEEVFEEIKESPPPLPLPEEESRYPIIYNMISIFLNGESYYFL